MIRQSVSGWEYRTAPFIIVPKDNRLPIRVMSASDHQSSQDPQFGYGYPIWTHGGKSSNPFYWENESYRFYYNKATGEHIQEGEATPSFSFFKRYEEILEEFHENWVEIVGTILEHHEEQITLKYKHFKVVSNVDTSILRY